MLYKKQKNHIFLILSLLLTPLFFSFSNLEASPFYYFIPPKEYHVADPSIIKGSIKMAFVSPKKKSFTPSINIALEKVSVSLEKYIFEVKKMYKKDRTINWSFLGHIKNNAGTAHVSKLTAKLPWGTAHILQAVTIVDGTAYIITGASDKKDLLDFQESFFEVAKTFTVVNSPYEKITDKVLKEDLIQRVDFLKTFIAKQNESVTFTSEVFQKGPWKEFDPFLTKSFKKEGLFFQMQLVKFIENELFPKT